jgi:hypothetical protein
LLILKPAGVLAKDRRASVASWLDKVEPVPPVPPLSLKAIAIDNLIFLDRQLSRLSLFDGKYVPTTAMLHAAFCRLNECSVFVLATAMAP